MKSVSMILAALGCLAVAMPAMIAPANAYVVREVIGHHHHDHGCRTVRTVRHGPHGKVVTVRKVCG